jgi:hypothetical protein
VRHEGEDRSYHLARHLGLVFIGHGTQKLFAWFEGEGLSDTGVSFDEIGLRPGAQQATAAGISETVGGALIARYVAHTAPERHLLAGSAATTTSGAADATGIVIGRGSPTRRRTAASATTTGT